MARIDRLIHRLQRVEAAGLDTAVFIYAFEQHPNLGSLAQTIFRAMENGAFRGYASVLALGEVLTGVKKSGDHDLLFRYRDAFQRFPGLTLCPCDVNVMETMSDLRVRYNLRIPDAIHVGTALVYGATAFITNDLHLRCVTELEIVMLADFAAEL